MFLDILALNNEQIDRVFRAHLTELSLRKYLPSDIKIRLIVDQYSWKWSSENTVFNHSFDDIIILPNDVAVTLDTSEPTIDIIDVIGNNGILIRAGYIPIGISSVGFWTENSSIIVDEMGIIIGIDCRYIDRNDTEILRDRIRHYNWFKTPLTEPPILTRLYPMKKFLKTDGIWFQMNKWFSIDNGILTQKLSHFLISDSSQVQLL